MFVWSIDAQLLTVYLSTGFNDIRWFIDLFTCLHTQEIKFRLEQYSQYSSIMITVNCRVLTEIIIAIVAVSVEIFLRCNWATGTMHSHTEDLNEQCGIMAGEWYPMQE